MDDQMEYIRGVFVRPVVPLASYLAAEKYRIGCRTEFFQITHQGA